MQQQGHVALIFNTQGQVMTVFRWLTLRAAALLACSLLVLGLTGCGTTTGVSRDTVLKEDEGLVTLRLIDLGSLAITDVKVKSEVTGKVYQLYSMAFGQRNMKTFLGRLPAGRYQPSELHAFWNFGTYSETLEIPLDDRTGKFDVQPGRVTELGTLVYEPLGIGREFKFVAAMDPTPVPVGAMLAARFPQLSMAVADKPTLGWIAGTVPRPARPDLVDLVRGRVIAVTKPTFMDADTLLTSGPLGVVSQWRPGSRRNLLAAPTIHNITAMQALKDGRWLIGGEEGYSAVSTNTGKSWQVLAPLNPEGVVMQFAQYEDGRLLAVSDLDREVVVYESPANPIAWKEVRRIPSDRGENLSVDYAAISKERLMIFTRPDTLTSVDLRTGQWESFKTSFTFNWGIKSTADGYLVGMVGPMKLMGSEDYGKTWKKIEGWVRMTQPHFFDRRRGVMLAAETGKTGQQKGGYKLRTTNDGGATWVEGAETSASFGFLQPLWSDPTGSVLYTATNSGVQVSRDQGRTWN